MEEVKICISCGKNLGRHVCISCGALVCDYCFSRKRGLCANCVRGKRITTKI